MIDTHETLVEAKKAAEVLAKSTIKRMKDTERPNIEAIKEALNVYTENGLREIIRDLIAYIGFRGQVRSEEEIREVSEKLELISDHWGGYIKALKWVLEDSDLEAD